jgi:hypothetical protein
MTFDFLTAVKMAIVIFVGCDAVWSCRWFTNVSERHSASIFGVVYVIKSRRNVLAGAHRTLMLGITVDMWIITKLHLHFKAELT